MALGRDTPAGDAWRAIDERLGMDIEYVKTADARTDLRQVARTVGAVVGM